MEARDRLLADLEEARAWRVEAREAQSRAAFDLINAINACASAVVALGQFDRAHPLSGIEQEETG